MGGASGRKNYCCTFNFGQSRQTWRSWLKTVRQVSETGMPELCENTADVSALAAGPSLTGHDHARGFHTTTRRSAEVPEHTFNKTPWRKRFCFDMIDWFPGSTSESLQHWTILVQFFDHYLYVYLSVLSCFLYLFSCLVRNDGPSHFPYKAKHDLIPNFIRDTWIKPNIHVQFTVKATKLIFPIRSRKQCCFVSFVCFCFFTRSLRWLQ